MLMLDGSDQLKGYAIAIEVSDPVLFDALAERLEEHPGLYLVALEDAPDIVIVDEIERGSGTRGSRNLLLADDADAALPSNADPNLILAAAYVMASGYEVMPRVGKMAASAATPRQDVDAGEEVLALTPREQDVVNLLVEGASNKHIARALDITERTAKFHVTAVIRKLHARNRSEVVAIALRDGLAAL